MKCNRIFFWLCCLLLLGGCLQKPIVEDEQSKIVREGVICDLQSFQRAYYRFPHSQGEFERYIEQLVPYYYFKDSQVDSIRFKTLLFELENETLESIYTQYGVSSICLEYALMKHNKKMLDFFSDSVIVYIYGEKTVFYPLVYTDSVILENDFQIQIYDKDGECMNFTRMQSDSLLHEIHLAKSETHPQNSFYRPMIIKYNRTLGMSLIYIRDSLDVRKLQSLNLIENQLKVFFNHRKDVEEIIVPQKIVW